MPSSGVAVSIEAEAEASRDGETDDARDWWGQRELKVERELTIGLRRRMEAQRAQIHAFKTEQSKWEHELQLRISKYAHDRKLLSEHNVELQEALTSMEAKFAAHQHEMDLQVHRVIELEGLLHESQVDAQEMRELQAKNEELAQRLRQWDRFHRAESAAAAKAQTTQQEELLAEVERVLAVAGDETAVRQQLGTPSELETTRKPSGARTSRIKGRGDEEDNPFVTRIKELEAACKQKVREDQAIHSLKTVVERQETAFDEKLKLVTAKYDQVKTINMALQVR
ncbi:hypothetical protein BBJ28_00014053 [Nothophytophthora sp. Chile5]|nr:hypothetical protein BBJ28_00014053 [Nothophytophthora sp. Chile5]